MSQKKNSKPNLFFKEPIFKVAELVFTKPNARFHLRGIAKAVGLSTTAIAAAIQQLQLAGVVVVEKTSLATNIQANRESEAYRVHKQIFNLYRLEQCGLIKKVRDACHAEVIVLFGSFAHGEDEEKSDIDLLVLTPLKQNDIGKVLASCESPLKKQINVQMLTSLDRSSPEFKNAVANGIVLYGYMKVV